MNKSYLESYSEKWQRAIDDGKYHEALGIAARGYFFSRDMEDSALETLCLAYMSKAIDIIRSESRAKMVQLDNEKFLCSFCGRNGNEVKIIAGGHANICNECVSVIQADFDKQ